MIRQSCAFTMLEMLVTIMIIGVLAAAALPVFFQTIEYSRGSETMIALSTLRNSVERCYLMTADYTRCNSMMILDVEDPSNLPNAHFSYTVNPSAPTAFSITAVRNTRDGGSTASTIWLNFDGSTITKGGTGAFGAVY